jgi:hypothetical protein
MYFLNCIDLPDIEADEDDAPTSAFNRSNSFGNGDSRDVEPTSYATEVSDSAPIDVADDADGVPLTSATSTTSEPPVQLHVETSSVARKVAQKRKTVFEDDSDVTKHPKRRWTPQEQEMFFAVFGSDVTNKLMPDGKRTNELAKKMSYSRTAAQIRTIVHNYISGKKNLA